MVQDSYWLPPRKARLCRVAGNLFLLSAAAMLVVIAFAGLPPGASPHCGEGGCFWNPQPLTLLDTNVRLEVEASPDTMRAFDAHVRRPDIRLALAGADAIDSVPFGFLLLCVGLALRQFGTQDVDALARGLPWLRRASLAAIIWTVVSPLYDSVVETVLSPGTPSGAAVQISIYLSSLATGLLLAMAGYAAIWALEAGLRTQRDLENFV
ncbi:hypothetical protein [Sphingomonas sp. PP-CC-3G-468]|uniref:hypothetical protein n=1 Tax=Sphingomonas sp. PP-CC-3G-468 TaxID=2135656 RepID=UPI001045B426|nr:hypothetical protein [Sphingomonas sp. PP-CC-3G-468]TCM04724.1 hypothetical protein C8J41_10820 [Sphingomonas sp. PP-CC-3G-468]